METIIYAVIAGILIYRLYTTLGQRDGNESQRRARPNWKPGNPFAPKDADGSTKNASADKDDLLALPLAVPKDQAAQPVQNYPQQSGQQARGFTPPLAQESLAGALFAIQKLDPNFEERSFLKGARQAFEMIVRAFAAGERGTLKNLLTPALYVSFEQAISERELRGERWEIQTVAIKDMDVITASLDGTIAQVTVQCVSDQSKFVFDKNGARVMDPNHPTDGRSVERLTDIWTFKRDTKSNNPNWQLSETRSV